MNLNLHANLRLGGKGGEGCSLTAPQKTKYRFPFANRTLTQTLHFFCIPIYSSHSKKSDKLEIREFVHLLAAHRSAVL